MHSLTHFSVVSPFIYINFLSNMPNRWSVDNCSSNYDGTNYTPVFEMLSHWSKEVKEEWRRFLHRDDAWELAKVFICLKHFSDNDVLLHFDIPMGDVTVKKVPRKPGLRKMQSPSIYQTVLLIYKDLLNTQIV